MELILILGPMKSGKSFDLISHFAPLQYTDIPFELYQSARNVRDAEIWSRNGISLKAKKVHDLSETLQSDAKVIGIDEVHMFEEDNATYVDELLKRGVKVIVSGLDTSYQGNMFGIVKRLLELGPTEVTYRKSVCEECRVPNAIYTQVFKDNKPLFKGDPVLPEDGTYIYKPVCRNCFVRESVV